MLRNLENMRNSTSFLNETLLACIKIYTKFKTHNRRLKLTRAQTFTAWIQPHSVKPSAGFKHKPLLPK